MIVNELIERLKKNKYGFMFLEKEEKAFLRKHFSSTQALAHGGVWHLKSSTAFDEGTVYRLIISFKLPYNGLFIPDVDMADPELCTPSLEGCACITVIESETEFSDNMGMCCGIHCKGCICDIDNRDQLTQLIEDKGGQRTAPAYVEYPVFDIKGEWKVDLSTTGCPEAMTFLDEMPRVKGFGGVKFQKADGSETTWSDEPTWVGNSGKPPLTPLRIRRWEHASAKK